MTDYLIQETASYRMDEIYRYTLQKWGQKQADRYIQGLFDSFGKIASHEVLSRPVPADFGIQGFFYHFEKHFVYWKHLANGQVGIVTVLHERMHQISRFKDDFGL